MWNSNKYRLHSLVIEHGPCGVIAWDFWAGGAEEDLTGSIMIDNRWRWINEKMLLKGSSAPTILWIFTGIIFSFNLHFSVL